MFWKWWKTIGRTASVILKLNRKLPLGHTTRSLGFSLDQMDFYVPGQQTADSNFLILKVGGTFVPQIFSKGCSQDAPNFTQQFMVDKIRRFQAFLPPNKGCSQDAPNFTQQSMVDKIRRFQAFLPPNLVAYLLRSSNKIFKVGGANLFSQYLPRKRQIKECTSPQDPSINSYHHHISLATFISEFDHWMPSQ